MTGNGKELIHHVPGNPDEEQEPTPPLFLHCPYTNGVWEKMGEWTTGLVAVPAANLDVSVRRVAV